MSKPPGGRLLRKWRLRNKRRKRDWAKMVAWLTARHPWLREDRQLLRSLGLPRTDLRNEKSRQWRAVMTLIRSAMRQAQEQSI